MQLLVDTPTSEYVAPTSSASGSTAPLPVAASTGSRWIDVDLTNQRVYAYEGDTVVNSFIVSTGTWLHPTVTGQYNIYVKYRSAPMSGPGYYLPNVPYIMYFYKGYGLHGTYWHSNFGTPMSHGCVNLRTDEAAWLYNWASVGTLVNVHY
jgi:lipoprotein-anchoring transpeptidase ErfK/SrfK